MVENADEGAIRYDVLADAVKEQVDLDASTVCVAVSTPQPPVTSPPRSPRF